MPSLSPADEGLLGVVNFPAQGSLRMPGPTYDTAKLVQELLQINHIKYDWQFNTSGFHNHLSHSILAAYSLGATPDAIQATYDLHARQQRPMCAIQRRISFQNWTRWLGQDDYYSAYLVFFKEEIQKYGAVAVLERYLFKLKDGQLLIRAMSGALHPLIQIGHGVEFNIEALVAEGLAQACVHSPEVAGLFESGWPNPSAPSQSSGTSSFAAAFSHFKALKAPVMNTFGSSYESFLTAAQRLNPSRPRHPRKGLSAFTIISHILKDPRLAAGQANRQDDFPRLAAAIRNRGDLIRAWCEEWIIDEAAGWAEIVEKMEELFWVATVLVGASSRPGYKPRMDFFMMHGLTSALFLPGMLEMLSPSSRAQLLHSHFRVMIGYWVSRGRPYLYISEALMAAAKYPAGPKAAFSVESALHRAIQRDEAKAHQNGMAKSSHSSDKSDEPKVHESSETVVSLKQEPVSPIDGQVDVSLDSPTEEKSEMNTLMNTQASNNTPPAADAIDAEDGQKTPTKAQSTQSQRPDPSQQVRSEKSSIATWADIIVAAVDHSDEHVTKMIRSLAFAAQNFGTAPAGIYRCALPGSEQLDGSIFLRLAGILLGSLGWEHFGEEAGSWDRSVLGFDEAWRDETREILEQKSTQQSEVGSLSEAYKIGTNRTRSNTIFDKRADYPRKIDKGKGRAVDYPVAVEEPISEQERLQMGYFASDDDPSGFGEHQQWAEGVV